MPSSSIDCPKPGKTKKNLQKTTRKGKRQASKNDKVTSLVTHSSTKGDATRSGVNNNKPTNIKADIATREEEGEEVMQVEVGVNVGVVDPQNISS